MDTGGARRDGTYTHTHTHARTYAHTLTHPHTHTRKCTRQGRTPAVGEGGVARWQGEWAFCLWCCVDGGVGEDDMISNHSGRAPHACQPRPSRGIRSGKKEEQEGIGVRGLLKGARRQGF